jgi:tubulin-specific chaperone D
MKLIRVLSGADGIDDELLNQIFQTLMKGIDDYTVDSRGDIGAIVRESAMSSLQVRRFQMVVFHEIIMILSLQTVLELSSKSRPDYLKLEMVSAVLSALVKQATEQIRRTRLLAATVFYSLIYW